LDFEFLESKDGEKTAKANGFFLHSQYSPQKEAQRFVELLTCPFQPEYIVITEPGIGYITSFLKEKFPSAKIGAIRFTNEFDSFNSRFNFIFYKKSGISIQNQLQNYFSEDKIFSVFFVSWKPSEKAFQKENDEVWKEIKAALDYSKTILVTRQFFEKKWLLNTINFIKYSKNYYSLIKSDLPVIITASGPSLEENIPVIKNLQNISLIVALSSALPVLLKNNIIPDLCMTTDGGYWAKEHLKQLRKNNIPLAMTCEADCQKLFLKNNPVIPLYYNDGLSKKICGLTEIPFVKVERNGTISGTALELFLNFTSDKIYFFGLDLCEAKGFQHTQPNELETNSSISDFRLFTKEKRLSRQSFKNESLEIYKNWFQNVKLPQNKVFRIISDKYKKNNLGQITDITPEEFKKLSNEIIKSPDFKSKDKILKKITKADNQKSFVKIREFISSNCDTEEWKKALFPLDFTALVHNPQNEEIIQKLQKENSRLVSKLQKILNDE
jgi:hypothetical protein